jgi:catechol 2,3-dioxygenase-like lactoylglutathione lyase family enzyme
MTQSLALTTLVVHDYDEAIRFFCDRLGFQLSEDRELGDGKRWVVVQPSNGAGLLLARAANSEQASHIGNQTRGRVAFFLYTDDFNRDYHQMVQNGVQFLEEPRTESYGIVAVFVDLYGNKWDLLQPNLSGETHV